MKQSGFAQVEWSNWGIKVYCTDEVILDKLMTELKGYRPDFRVRDRYELISGEFLGFWIENFKTDDQAGWWFVKQVCQLGWEPFESSGFGIGSIDGWVKLRRLLPR